MPAKPACGRTDHRTTLRFLRLLEICNGGHCIAGSTVKLRHNDQYHAFGLELVRRCLELGLTAIDAGKLILRAEGVAFLRRALHPDAGYAAQHGLLELRPVGLDAAPVLVNAHESPLARLRDRKDRHGKPWLEDASFAAGERLRSDFERAGLQPRISASWGIGAGLGGHNNAARDISDFAVDARARVDAAIGALEPQLAGVALDVCCFLKGLEQVERERGWPPRSAKLMLKTALSILARHFGLSGGGQSNAPMQHWGTADFKPGSGRLLRYQGLAGFVLNPRHHRAQSIGALRGYMICELEPGKQRCFVRGTNSGCVFS